MKNKSYYNKNIIKDLEPSITLNPFFNEWYEIVEEILLSDEFQKRKLFPHHHKMTVWDHSTLVSFKSFIFGRIHHADERICAIAGLLHDFYPNAWLYNEELAKIDNGKYIKELKISKPLFKKHGFTHGEEASINYIKYFPHLENKKITDSIKKHMFPLTIIPPKYKEGYIITMVDKLNSVHELPSITVVPNIIKNQAIKIGNTISKRI